MKKLLIILVLLSLPLSNEVFAAEWSIDCFASDGTLLYSKNQEPAQCDGATRDPDPYPVGRNPSQPIVQIMNLDDVYYLILTGLMLFAFTSGIATGSDFS